MRKFLLITLLIVVIPYLVVSLFVAEDEIQFYFGDHTVVRVMNESTGVITSVPFEEYIVGVLAGEMPVSFELEALKAQAVAARSYVMKKMIYNREKEYDVVDTVNNQVYLSDDYLRTVWKDEYISKINKVKKAVVETKGEYLDYQGQVVEAFFFSTSVGMTENSEDVFVEKVPYLRSVKSEWDRDVSPVFQDQFTFNLSEFYIKLGLPYKQNIDVEVVEQTSTGRIKQVKINEVLFTGSDVFSKLGLRSTFFTIEQNGDDVTVYTKGYGHGVGMSQYGALGMALEGYTYDEILKYYYQGVTIKKI